MEIQLLHNGREVSLLMRLGNEADYHIGGRLMKDTYHALIDFQPRTIIDGGANIGTFAIHAKTRFPNARLICYEPDRANFEQLQLNLSRNSLDAQTHQAGLWSRAGVAYFHRRSSRTGFIQESGQGTQVPVVRPEIGADTWLKLDVEGAEHEILPTVLNGADKPRLITIEIHDFREKGAALLELLSRAGYSVECGAAGAVDPTYDCTTVTCRAT